MALESEHLYSLKLTKSPSSRSGVDIDRYYIANAYAKFMNEFFLEIFYLLRSVYFDVVYFLLRN